MVELNKANREVADVDIRELKTKKPFMNFNTANTTTAGISSDNVYAMAKGARRITFANPATGSMKIEAQVYPFKLFSLFSDGVVESSATYAARQTVTGESGKLSLTEKKGTIQAGSVFAYPEGQFGDDSAVITGTFASNVFTPAEDSKIAAGKKYEVGYFVTKTSGVKKISINDKKSPKDYFVTMTTVDKDEEGTLTSFLMTAYKATPKKNFELSFSSTGDPANVTLEFDLSVDKDGNLFDMIEIDPED